MNFIIMTNLAVHIFYRMRSGILDWDKTCFFLVDSNYSNSFEIERMSRCALLVNRLHHSLSVAESSLHLQCSLSLSFHQARPLQLFLGNSFLRMVIESSTSHFALSPDASIPCSALLGFK
jgi:hypothetical protein